jgi:Leucine-rich repeat (LRR) protein
MISINGKMVNKDIKKLDLSNNKLTQLPVEIVQLTQLTTLHLTNNNITKLPVEIRQLTQLTTLNLSTNKLTQLPVEIGQLTQLTTLHLSFNNLTQLPVEIGQLTQLTTLNLQNNKLTQLPVEIGQLTQLTTLYLQTNKLTNLPVEIWQLTQLTTLNLSYNKLTQLPVEIGQLTQLTELYLYNNNLTHLPVEIGQLTQLTTLELNSNKLTHLPVEIGHLIQLTSLYLSDNPVENLLNPIIQRAIQRIEHRANRHNGNNIYTDTQNIHSSSIQQSIRDSINKLMNAFIVDYPLTYLDWSVLNQKTKEIITEYIDCNDIHTMLNITFKELFIAVVIEMDKLSPDLQIEIKKRLNEEMQESECKCFTGRISRLVNCLSGYSDKICIQISENEEINNIISVIMNKRELKTIETLKDEVSVALKERGYADEKIAEWLEYVE